MKVRNSKVVLGRTDDEDEELELARTYLTSRAGRIPLSTRSQIGAGAGAKEAWIVVRG